MCGGQYLDTVGDGQPHTLEELTEINDKKTGALLRAACMMGIAAAAGERLVDSACMEAARDYATALGLAFQIRDDILDVEELACGLLSSVRGIYPQRLLERYKLPADALELAPYDLLLAIGAKRGMLVSGGEVDAERAARTVVGEFRASKWGRLSLERPPQPEEDEDAEKDS